MGYLPDQCARDHGTGNQSSYGDVAAMIDYEIPPCERLRYLRQLRREVSELPVEPTVAVNTSGVTTVTGGGEYSYWDGPAWLRTNDIKLHGVTDTLNVDVSNLGRPYVARGITQLTHNLQQVAQGSVVLLLPGNPARRLLAIISWSTGIWFGFARDQCGPVSGVPGQSIGIAVAIGAAPYIVTEDVWGGYVQQPIYVYQNFAGGAWIETWEESYLSWKPPTMG